MRALISGSTSTRRTRARVRAQSRAGAAWRDPRRPIRWSSSGRSRRGGSRREPPADPLRGKLRDALARFDEIAGRGGARRAASADRALGGSEKVPAEPLRPDRERAARSGRRAPAISDPPHRRRATGASFTRAASSRCAATASSPRATRRSRTRSRPRWRSPTASSRPMSAARNASGETQYRCLTEAYDYWRTHDPQQHRRARDCLERAMAATRASRSAMRRSPPWCWRNIARRRSARRRTSRPLCSARCRRRAAPSSSSPAARARIRRWSEVQFAARRLPARARGRRTRHDAQSL